MALRFDRDRLSSFSRFLWQRFIDDKCFETAGALSYTTLVSLVPLIVASLAIFAAFPAFADARATLIEFVFSNFMPAAGERVQEYLNGFADNASKLTGISVLVMFFSALSMMVSIEDRLNRIWRVRRQRGWVSRLLLYWAALTLGPVLIVGGIAVASYATAMPILGDAVGQLGLRQRLVSTLPFVVTFLTLMLIYMMVPNRRVRWQEAAIGALLGAVMFEIARWGFAHFIHHAHTYQQVYGAALAAIPIFLLWIYMSWVIVILCASVAASMEAFEYQAPATCLPDEDAFLGLLLVLRHFIDAHRQGVAVDLEVLRGREPRLSRLIIGRYIDDLQRADLIRQAPGGWLLSRSLDSTDLLRVYAHSHYRLPLRPYEDVQANGIELPEALLALLEQTARSLDVTLGTRLDVAYPVTVAPLTEDTDT
ncbi:YihY family inner membrane protein [Dyella sp. C9]|uniref:YihY family inner membrane protein n=1 Tax=Dyella sp. C9 TaxID=2202154 RepID=UPI000DEEB0BF|nr:YihY family inner membrane protein [Dyella sp. C9]